MVRRVEFRDTERTGLEPGKSPTDGKPEAGRNWYAIIFVSCWLGGWTLAIFWTTADWSKALNEGDVAGASFDRTWLILAIVGWIAAAIYLMWLLLGGKAPRAWRGWGGESILVRERATAASTSNIARNWFAIIFISVWLIGWTIGIVIAFGMLIVFTIMGVYEGTAFLVFWLGAAVVGWIVGVRYWKYLYRGGSVLTWSW